MKCCDAQTYEGYDKRSTQQVILECDEEECGVKACQNRQAGRQVEQLEKRKEENDGSKVENHSNMRGEMRTKSGISSSLIIVCVVIVLLAILIPLLTRKG